jgi:hypothetical protein
MQVKYVLENCKEDMEFFNTWIEKGIINRLNVRPKTVYDFHISLDLFK